MDHDNPWLPKDYNQGLLFRRATESKTRDQWMDYKGPSILIHVDSLVNNADKSLVKIWINAAPFHSGSWRNEPLETKLQGQTIRMYFLSLSFFYGRINIRGYIGDPLCPSQERHEVTVHPSAMDRDELAKLELRHEHLQYCFPDPGEREQFLSYYRRMVMEYTKQKVQPILVFGR